MSSGATRMSIVDAFTTAVFTGNPAAVCWLESAREQAWMRALARELQQPATCFVQEADGYHLRWFAPSAELDLCGHGTLAAAHVVLEQHTPTTDSILFNTLAGNLVCRREGNWIAMEFPAESPTHEPNPPPALLEALGRTPRVVARNRYDFLVELASVDEVQAFAPNLAQLQQVATRGFIVTAPADRAGDDFISRFFAVVLGGAEDAVTGSAHCAIGPGWGERLGKTELVGWQASTCGGRVRVRLRDIRVDLLGQATTILQGMVRV